MWRVCVFTEIDQIEEADDVALNIGAGILESVAYAGLSGEVNDRCIVVY